MTAWIWPFQAAKPGTGVRSVVAYQATHSTQVTKDSPVRRRRLAWAVVGASINGAPSWAARIDSMSTETKHRSPVVPK